MAEPIRSLMKTETRKSYFCGFALTESEIRRLHDVIIQQLKRASPVGHLESVFEVKFRNGAVGNPATLDDVLSQENFGSGTIVRLRLKLRDISDKALNSVECEFINPDATDEKSGNSISYEVLGNDRDWVFLTSSQIEERIEKIRVFAPSQLGSKRLSFTFWLALIFPIAMIGQFYLLDRNTKSIGEAQFDVLSQQHKVGLLSDPIDATIKVGRIVEQRNGNSLTVQMWPMFLMFLLPAGAFLIRFAYVYFQPLYNFLWGDYVTFYEKRKSRGRFLLIGVGLTIVLGTLVNFISKRIGF